MNRRMREAKIVKVQLAQERKTSAHLRNQLSVSQTQLASVETLVSSLRADFHSKESQLLAVSESEKTARSHIQTLEDKLRVLEEKLATSEKRIDKVKEAAQKGVRGLGRGYEELKKDMERLGEEGGEAGTKKVLGQLKEEAEGLRKGARDGLEGISFPSTLKYGLIADSLVDIQAYFDPSGRRLLKCEETRELVRELENERNDAHQVIDLLRNKLHLQSTQLAEYQQRINDSEQTRKEESKQLMKSVGVWEETGKRVGEVVEWIEGAEEREKEREVAREKERERLVFESKLEEAIERNKVLEAEVDKEKEELDKVQKENESIYARCEKLDDICKTHEQCSRKYDAAQATIQEKEEEIVILREHVREWKEKKEIADASLEKCQTRMTALESRLCKSVESEAVLRTQADYALEKVKALEGEVTRLKSVEGENEEERKGLSGRLGILQERFDAQTMTIKLVKEHSGDVQERLVQSEKTHAATLEQVKAKYTTELAISEEQKATLQTTISDLKQDLENTRLTLDLVSKEKATLESALSASRTTLAVLEAENESVKDKLGRCEKEVEKLESMGRKLDSEVEIGKERTRVLESALDKSNQDLETLRKDCMTCRIELGTAKSERAGLDIVLEEVKRERDGLREEALGLRKETARLEGAIELSKREAGRMVEVTVGEMEAKIGVLTEKNKILQEEQEREKAKREEVVEESKEEGKKLKLKLGGLEDLLQGLSGMIKGQVEKMEKVYEDRIKAELDKAGIAEMGLEGALRLSQELEQRVKSLQEEVKLKTGTRMDEEVGDETCRKLTERISELEGEIQKLEERAGTLGARYKVGDLNDSEKAFVDSLMGISQAMYEQDMVDKDNELRRVCISISGPGSDCRNPSIC
ncbi:hypothetical protein K435DRAFT_187422 [Dendrothele bispora CBS 962.96]|uniref:Uncharacterized protein n=1 Tax=Dendrothele bispora (strain CBS 962.96) TaxID=1314807 RepID=A0A4S8MNZ5_DENBC|nr:hypothetical protein K435DRAFT_187422 [Dendrothele bispora CBS 962.96]